MEILFILVVGFVLAGAFGWEVARIVRQARWISEWEDEMGEIAVSVALSDETFEWARQKAAEKGEGLRDFLGGVIEEAKRKEEKGFREKFGVDEYNAGREDGYDVGFDDGYAQGYEAGYAKGISGEREC